MLGREGALRLGVDGDLHEAEDVSKAGEVDDALDRRLARLAVWLGGLLLRGELTSLGLHAVGLGPGDELCERSAPAT